MNGQTHRPQKELSKSLQEGKKSKSSVNNRYTDHHSMVRMDFLIQHVVLPFSDFTEQMFGEALVSDKNSHVWTHNDMSITHSG